MSTPRFAVFLSYCSEDQALVLRLATKLRDVGLNPWLDVWHLIAGENWLRAVDEALENSDSCAVIIGPGGLGHVHENEMWVALQRSVELRRQKQRFRVIPVLLPNATRGERGRLPSFLTGNSWVEFHGSIDDAHALDGLVRAISEGTFLAIPQVASHLCPYRGLQYFDIQHKPLFFGRAGTVDWLLSRLRGTASKDGATNFLAIVGASGSGKSSIARAGVLARIRDGELPDSSAWPIVICRPGTRPLEELAGALASNKEVDLGTGLTADLILDVMNGMLVSAEQLHRVALAATSSSQTKKLVILVDQFEELFTLGECANATLPIANAIAADRNAFVDNLLKAVSVDNSRTVVIVTMRADFYGHCATHSDLAAVMSRHHELIGPMSEDELRQAIQVPAQLAGACIEEGLVDLLVREAQAHTGALPLLQFALSELWHKSHDQKDRSINATTYREMGGWTGALRRRADSVLAQFRDESQIALCKQLFLRLVSTSGEANDTKVRVPLSDLDGDPKTRGILNALIDARLLTVDSSTAKANATIEIAHEALIRSWPQLLQWINDNRAELVLRSRLQHLAKDWFENDYDPSFLLRGSRLSEMEAVVVNGAGFTNREVQFLESSVQQRQIDAEQSMVYRRPGIISFIVFVHCMIGTASVITLVVTCLLLFHDWYKSVVVSDVQVSVCYASCATSVLSLLVAKRSAEGQPWTQHLHRLIVYGLLLLVMWMSWAAVFSDGFADGDVVAFILILMLFASPILGCVYFLERRRTREWFELARTHKRRCKRRILGVKEGSRAS